MRICRGFIALWVCALVSSTDASAQQRLETLRVGDRVRVSSDVWGMTGQVATVGALGTDTLFLSLATGLVPVAVDAIGQLEVSRGRHSRGASTAMGAALGTGLGLVVAVLQGMNCPSDGTSCYVVEFSAPPLGLLIGGLLGWRNAPELWEEQSLTSVGR